LAAGPYGEPRRVSEIAVVGRVVAGQQDPIGYVRAREVHHRIATWFMQEDYLLAVSDPLFGVPNPYPSSEPLGVQQPLG
jgi:hypothetical protein